MLLQLHTNYSSRSYIETDGIAKRLHHDSIPVSRCIIWKLTFWTFYQQHVETIGSRIFISQECTTSSRYVMHVKSLECVVQSPVQNPVRSDITYYSPPPTHPHTHTHTHTHLTPTHNCEEFSRQLIEFPGCRLSRVVWCLADLHCDTQSNKRVNICHIPCYANPGKHLVECSHWSQATSGPISDMISKKEQSYFSHLLEYINTSGIFTLMLFVSLLTYFNRQKCQVDSN